MPEIVIRDRAVGRLLALLPALAIASAVRLLTLGNPPVAVRVLGAAVVAMGAWTAYRLLTARVVVGEAGVHVRGVLYDADIAWSDLEEVVAAEAPLPVRVLMTGLVQPWSVSLVARSKRLRPVAMLSGPHDEEIEQAIRAMRLRLGVWSVPEQRRPGDGAVRGTGVSA